MPRKLILIAMGGLVVTAVAFAPQRTQLVAIATNVVQVDAEALVKKGDEFRAAHHYHEAIDAYAKAIGANPKLANAYVGMGIAQMRTHLLDEAEVSLKKSLEIAPKNVTALRYLAETYMKMDAHAEASPVLKQALALAPERFDLHYLMAAVDRRTNHEDDAKVEYGKAQAFAEVELVHNPKDVEVYSVLTRILEELHNNAEAAEWAQKWVSLDPGDVEAHEYLAFQYYYLKKYPEAIIEFQAASKLDTSYLGYYWALANVYEASGRKDDAQAVRRDGVRAGATATEQAPKFASNYFWLSEFHDSLGEPDEALSELQKGVMRAPRDYWAHYYLAEKYGELKRYADAIPQYEAATKIRPDLVYPWTRLVIFNFELKQWTSVISAGAQALKLKNDDPEIYNYVGVANYNLSHFAEAAKEFQEAIRWAPSDWKDFLATVHHSLGNSYVLTGNREGAMQEYNILKALDESQAATLLNAINPPQPVSQPATVQEPAPKYEYFRVRAIRSEREVPEGHEDYGYYVYNTVTALDTGQECTLRCWHAFGKNGNWSDNCSKMRDGETYNAKREYKLLDAKRGYEYIWTYIEMNIDGTNVWVEFLGCAKN